MARLLTAIAVAITTIVAGSAAAVADTGSDAMGLEIVGFELTPLSFNLGSPGSGRPSPTRFQPGPGGALRLGKLRWPGAYWTMVQVGLFVGGDTNDPGTVFAHIETEAGVTLNTGAHTFELGLGVGAGILAIQYQPTGCDGSCYLGGAGVFVSPVARYMVRQAAPYSFALVARADVLAARSSTNCLSTCNGRATLFLIGLDLGFGFARARPPPPVPLTQVD